LSVVDENHQILFENKQISFDLVLSRISTRDYAFIDFQPSKLSQLSILKAIPVTIKMKYSEFAFIMFVLGGTDNVSPAFGSQPSETCERLCMDSEKVLVCIKHREHYHQYCVKSEELDGLDDADDRTFAACGCCTEDEVVQGELLDSQVELKFGSSADDKETGCPSLKEVICDKAPSIVVKATNYASDLGIIRTNLDGSNYKECSWTTDAGAGGGRQLKGGSRDSAAESCETSSNSCEVRSSRSTMDLPSPSR
jgi:hypothetical protein